MDSRNTDYLDNKLRDIEFVNIRENYAYSLSHDNIGANTSTDKRGSNSDLGGTISRNYKELGLKGFEVLNISESLGPYLKPFKK